MSVRLRSRRWDLVNYLSSQLKPLHNLFYTWQFAPSMIHWILTFGIAPCLHRIWTCCILQCKKSSLFKGLYLNVDVKNNPCQYPTEDMQSNNIFYYLFKTNVWTRKFCSTMCDKKEIVTTLENVVVHIVKSKFFCVIYAILFQHPLKSL